MPRYAFILLCSLLFAMAPAFAAEPSHVRLPDCGAAFAALEAELKKSELTSSFTDIEKQQLPTVTVTEAKAGAYGGKLLTLERTGPAWGSQYVTAEHDLQGDPRWFIEMFGPEAAARFGFAMKGPSAMTVPDVAEFSGALRALDAELLRRGQEPVALRFYGTATSENSRVGAYLDQFTARRAIPLAPEGNHLVHDLSFHSPSIVLPRSLLDEAAGYTEYWVRFADHLRAKAPNVPAEQERARAYAYFIKYFQVTQIDYATAMLTPQYVAYLRREAGADVPLKTYVGELVQTLLPYTGFNQLPSSPADYSRAVLLALFKRGDFHPLKSSPRYKHLAGELAAHINEVSRELTIFSMTYQGERVPSFQPFEQRLRNRADTEAWLEEMCQEILRRRRELRDAMLALPASK